MSLEKRVPCCEIQNIFPEARLIGSGETELCELVTGIVTGIERLGRKIDMDRLGVCGVGQVKGRSFMGSTG